MITHPSPQLFSWWTLGSPKKLNCNEKLIWWQSKGWEFSIMWNWKSTQDADDEEQQDYLLEGTEGLCSLSPLQVFPSKNSWINCLSLMYQFKDYIFTENPLWIHSLCFPFIWAEDLWVWCLFTSWSCLYVPGMIIDPTRIFSKYHYEYNWSNFRMRSCWNW